MSSNINERVQNALTAELQRIISENMQLRYQIALMRATLAAHDLIQDSQDQDQVKEQS